MNKKHAPLGEPFLTKKISHRGLHSDTVSENSLQAFRLAIDGGYAIELDVHLLTDGEIAVVHDCNLFRVTGQDVTVETLSSKDLEKYPLLIGGEKIPTLKETLALVNGKAPLLIELKFCKGFDKKLADALLSELENYPHKNTVALQSFHPFTVRYLKKQTSDYPVGFLTSGKLPRGKLTTFLSKSLRLQRFMRADFFAYDINYLPNRYVEKKRKQGYKILAWTVDSPEKQKKAALYADNIIFEKLKV